MKITVLCENSVSMIHECKYDIKAEHGLSLFIEINGINILFDTASKGQYVKNAKIFWIDLQKTDFIVLSHNHEDHSWGLLFHNFKTKKKIIFHPQVLKDLPNKEAKKIQKEFEVISSSAPIEFTPNIFFLWEIPCTTHFESGMKTKGDKIYKVKDDSAIAIKTPKWVFVVTGCSHSGIGNICEYAKKITGQKLLGVMWWFHLFWKFDKKALAWTITYFKKEKVKYLYPMHCVDFEALMAIYKGVPFEKLWTGSSIEVK